MHFLARLSQEFAARVSMLNNAFVSFLHDLMAYGTMFLNALSYIGILALSIVTFITAILKLRAFGKWWWLWTVSSSVGGFYAIVRLSQFSSAYWFAFIATVGALALSIYLVCLAVLFLYEKIRGRHTKKVDMGPRAATTIESAVLDRPRDDMTGYNPAEYFRGDKGFFVGLANGRPVYQAVGSRPMVLVAGTTGCGKGRLIQQRIAQSIKHGEAVIVFDPKFDEWLPHVCFSLAKEHGRDYRFVDLGLAQPAQINLCANASAIELEEVFKAGAGLGEHGKPSDFYLFADRRAAQLAAEYIAKHACTFSDCHRVLGPVLEKDAPRFAGILRELARLPAINAIDDGDALGDTIADGAVLYIHGSLRDDQIKRVQRMTLVRVIQIAESRDRFAGASRKVCIVLDEFKHHISRIAIEALATVRDKGVHVLLAFQSIGDLADVGGDLNPEAVKDAVMQNCGLQFVYRVMGKETADFFADNSGTKNITQETKTYIQRGAVFVERYASRSLRTESAPHIEANEILTLADAEAVVFGLGVPIRVAIAPVRVEKSESAVCVTERCASRAFNDSKELI